ncbi:hypothetical protein PPO43_06415 [Saprospira sp. CCB-QB6]|uniref:hypothetical protein n=1 Tax=Saprospira sp. CCB-QB6 TaxID=3023936 RepID=UPI00234A7D5D|nr:hypothetical protein [Saprospira sp. CCB-QB6]WCL82724.1 hypothetical protein PPO43_06415 [Saprospira sp. CCB-QB6]
MMRLLLLFCCWSWGLNAQLLQDKFALAYPERPYSVAALKEAGGYNDLSVWLSINQLDSSLSLGALGPEVQAAYQLERHILRDGKPYKSSYYLPTGDKERRLDYYYRQGQILAIDEFEFDSLQEDRIKYLHTFLYKKDSVPLQKVTEYKQEQQFRQLFVYDFDEQGRLLRQRVEDVGKMRDLNEMQAAWPNKSLLLYSYEEDAQVARLYHDQHRLIYRERAQLNEEGQVLTKTRKDRMNRLIWDENYQYSSHRLYKKERHSFNAEGERKLAERIFYEYEGPAGLLSRKIVEKEGLQYVYDFQYSISE